MSVWLPYPMAAVGGFLGADARFVIASGVAAAIDTPFPPGTFVIHVSGSFLLGVPGAVMAGKVLPDSDALKPTPGAGFPGVFTRFSTFALETHAPLEDGSGRVATLDIAASVIPGPAAVRAGIVAGKARLP
jgi:CrcB protein